MTLETRIARTLKAAQTPRAAAPAPPTLTEHQEQALLMSLCEAFRRKYPETALLFAIPNGYKKSRAEQGKAKREGLKSGVPDLFLPVARGDYHGLFIELKRSNGRNSDLSEKQSDWCAALSANRYRVDICFGADAAWEVIKLYLTLPTNAGSEDSL